MKLFKADIIKRDNPQIAQEVIIKAESTEEAEKKMDWMFGGTNTRMYSNLAELDKYDMFDLFEATRKYLNERQ